MDSIYIYWFIYIYIYISVCVRARIYYVFTYWNHYSQQILSAHLERNKHIITHTSEFLHMHWTESKDLFKTVYHQMKTYDRLNSKIIKSNPNTQKSMGIWFLCRKILGISHSNVEPAAGPCRWTAGRGRTWQRSPFNHSWCNDWLMSSSPKNSFNKAL